MKHLIETAGLSNLPIAEYDRLILDSTTNEIVYRGVKYEYVDLGLPSGLKWAKCNVGAETETDYGYYFQWGDIVDKSNAVCDWSTYKYCNGSYTIMTKYCTDSSYGTVDNKTTLEPEDDAATQIMGDDWRMPTTDEFQELSNNTTNEWVTNYDGSGVNGYKFTSSNGNSIFIPASGYRYESSFLNQGHFGEVWSSSVVNDNASTLYFALGDLAPESYDFRCYGLSVRGVCK